MANESFPRAAELRAAALSTLRGHWTNPVLCTLVYVVIVGACSAVPVINYVAPLLVTAPLGFGYSVAFLRHVRGEADTDLISRPFDAFKDYGRYLATSLLVMVFTFLWSLLLFVPGIIMGIAYSMTPFIMRDNPELGAMDCIKKSKQMMRGHKWQYFCLMLSFIGWLLLACITCGIGMLWVTPYMECAQARFYEELKPCQA